MLRRCGQRLSALLVREFTRRHCDGDRTHARDPAEVRRLTIERAGSDDLAAIVPLFCDYLRFYEAPIDVERATTFVAERLAGTSVFYVACVDARTVAFAHLFPAYATLAQRTMWVLEDLFVAAHARGAVRLTLVTAKTNRVAQHTYERSGWQRDEHFVTYERPLA